MDPKGNKKKKTKKPRLPSFLRVSCLQDFPFPWARPRPSASSHLPRPCRLAGSRPPQASGGVSSRGRQTSPLRLPRVTKGRFSCTVPQPAGGPLRKTKKEAPGSRGIRLGRAGPRLGPSPHSPRAAASRFSWQRALPPPARPLLSASRTRPAP